MPRKRNEIFERRGVVYITDELLNTDPDLVRKALGRCIVTRAEYRFDSQRMEYIVCSELLDIVPECMKCPEYAIELRKCGRGQRVVFRRVGKNLSV